MIQLLCIPVSISVESNDLTVTGCIAVTFEQVQSARDCAAALHGQVFNGYRLYTKVLLPQRAIDSNLPLAVFDLAQSCSAVDYASTTLPDTSRLDYSSHVDQPSSGSIVNEAEDLDNFLNSLL